MKTEKCCGDVGRLAVCNAPFKNEASIVENSLCDCERSIQLHPGPIIRVLLVLDKEVIIVRRVQVFVRPSSFKLDDAIEQVQMSHHHHRLTGFLPRHMIKVGTKEQCARNWKRNNVHQRSGIYPIKQPTSLTRL